MLDYSQLRWSSVGTKTYEVTNWKDFFSIRLNGTSKRLLRIDWTHNKYLDHTLLVGYLHGTVEIFGREATAFEQKIYLGSNLVFIPQEIQTVKNFYLNHYKSYGGKFTLQAFEPTTQVVINPITNEPVILGQESLNLIEDINEVYSQQVIDELSRKITVNIATELQQIENQVVTISTLLSGGI
ncbi:hypothetical protein [Cyanobacterium aponinum]|uniref:hypothetical protein n=1 Tax=Cyanobacterium aponinum TaxID=379064 RepID=UPI000C12E0C7|nr:hypothetical protein [Cyanobacterium aponinum]PHV63188.1 hypothetical protein CSQ80_06545 [Cyanobacterium aponinum IPPAS B-1201]